MKKDETIKEGRSSRAIISIENMFFKDFRYWHKQRRSETEKDRNRERHKQRKIENEKDRNRER